MSITLTSKYECQLFDFNCFSSYWSPSHLLKELLFFLQSQKILFFKDLISKSFVSWQQNFFFRVQQIWFSKSAIMLHCMKQLQVNWISLQSLRHGYFPSKFWQVNYRQSWKTSLTVSSNFHLKWKKYMHSTFISSPYIFSEQVNSLSLRRLSNEILTLNTIKLCLKSWNFINICVHTLAVRKKLKLQHSLCFMIYFTCLMAQYYIHIKINSMWTF